MMRRKRVSLRRWKARCRLGRPIPYSVIADYDLNRWFVFDDAGINADFWRARVLPKDLIDASRAK
jgi:hypothetical protein